MKHSLHRGVRQAKGFYAIYAGLIALSVTIVLIPGSPLGLLTAGVQTLAGVLLPSASVFLLLLCNDRQVLGPWVNSRATNVFTSVVVAILVTLSIILTSSVLFPAITTHQILLIMQTCGAAALLAAGYALFTRRGTTPPRTDRTNKTNWRMPPLADLPRPQMATGRKIGMTALRLYLAVAMVLVIVKIINTVLAH
jgi:hypothetical protein